jgi:phenylalanyl-tRNA synthetase alpha chain
MQWVKDKLCALGFEEFDGPLVENEFWNGDALFMPQFHSAVISTMSTTSRIRAMPGNRQPYLSQSREPMRTVDDRKRGWRYGFDTSSPAAMS